MFTKKVIVVLKLKFGMVPKLTILFYFKTLKYSKHKAPIICGPFFHLPGIGILIQILQYKGKKLKKAYVTWM
jgi:hypothetical protein